MQSAFRYVYKFTVNSVNEKPYVFIIRIFFNVVNIFYKKNVRFFKDFNYLIFT